MRSTDVVIVGAGFAGCATASALADRGVRALVLEREPALGRHASGRGAGLGRQLAEDDDTSQLAIRGAQLLRERFAAHWRPTGGVLTFDDAREANRYLERARSLDIPHETIERAAVLAHWPALSSLPIAAAILMPRDGVIDNRGLLHAYASRAVIEHGVSVTRVEPAGRGVRVEVARVGEGISEVARGEPVRGSAHADASRATEVIEARVVVDAAGAWAGAVTADPPLESFKRHLFTLEATAALDTPYLWHLGAAEVYVRPDAGGILACSCDLEPTRAADQQVSPDADARLLARLPPDWQPPIATRWACQRAFAPDRKMRIGRDSTRPWLVWAAALGGHGATASAAVGERAASAVLEALG